jgi:hypothetical protein
MVLKSYFEGGNQADSSEYDRITIATVCGTSKQWRRFETDWKKALYNADADYLHTTDAVSLKKEFSKTKGWTRARVDTFIGNCVTVIENHVAIPHGVPGKRARSGLYPITLTIPFDDWVRARKTVPTLPNSIEELCATESLSFALKWGRAIGVQFYELYYDRGERFYGHICDRVNHPKVKKDVELTKKITTLTQTDMRIVPALQMADLFAWCIGKANQESRYWHVRLHNIKFQARLLDYAHLINPSHAALKRIHSWKLPRRRPSELYISPKTND